MFRLILLRMLESFFRHRWSYLLTLILPLIAGVLFFIFVPPAYRVRGTIYVQGESLLTSLSDVTDVPAWINVAQETLAEAQSLVATESFAIGVLEKTEWRDELTKDPRTREDIIEEYRRSVAITAEGDNIVVFTAQDPNPVVAQQLAIETMNAYVQWRTNFIKTDSEVAQAFFAELITRYEAELEQAENELRDYLLLYPDPVRGDRSSEEKFEIGRLSGDVDEATKKLQDARAKEEDARLALEKATSGALQEYLVIDAPAVPTTPPSLLTRIVLIFSSFLFLGVLLTVLRLVLALTLDRSLYFPLDVQHGLKQPTLAMLPFHPTRSIEASGQRQPSASQEGSGKASSSQVSPVKN